MSDRNAQILNAAMTVFSRYGVAKTTMSDIAAEAGVARQTVYNAFPGKTEILRAVVALSHDQSLALIRAKWDETDDLGERIDIFFAEGPIKWFEAVLTWPDLAELLDGMNAIASAELAEGKKKWVSYFAQEFTASGLISTNPEISMRDIAEFLYSSSKTAKFDVKDRAEMATRLKVIKLSVLALIRKP